MAVLGLEVAYALLRPAPILESFDPSGEYGDASKPPLRVAVVGDSSVHAPGVERADQIWVSLICQRLAENHHVTLRSFAVGGSKAHDLLNGQMASAIAFAPNVVIVSVGANDVLKGVRRRTFAQNLDRLIKTLTASTDAVVIQSGVGVLGTIPRLFPPLSQLVSRRADRFDKVHWRVAESYGSTVINQRLDDAAAWQSDRTLWALDAFHVSPAGHARWADIAWKTIGPLLNGDRSA
jgi:lysophospholipase L1-like esterase